MPGVFIKNVTPTGFTSTPPLVTGILIDENGIITDLNATQPGDATVVDGNGAFLSPGWTDMHAHVWYGGTDLGVKMYQAGAQRGVTNVVDAGSAGECTFQGFRDYIWSPANSVNQKVYAFLNLGSPGLAASLNTTELPDYESINFDRLVEVISANRDVIFGIKIRASAVILREWGMEPVLVAKKMSRITGLRLMCHVGEAPPSVEDVAAQLQAGDIITHTYNGKVGGSLQEDSAIFNALRDAVSRGVYLDIGHGAASFSFEVFAYAIQNGLKPHSISTDIHARNVDGAVLDMATTMSKTLELGLTFDEVVAATTITPRRMLGLPVDNLLAVGAFADFTIFDLSLASEVVYDSYGNELTINRMFEPRWAIMGSTAVKASRNLPTAGQLKARQWKWPACFCC